MNRLHDVINRPLDGGEDSIIIDATIKRFEFTYECFWKSIKRLLQEHGIVTKNPKDTMKAAFSQEWIDAERLWINMRDDRNMTSHEYNHHEAKAIYERIKGDYYPELHRTYTYLMRTYIRSTDDAPTSH